MNAYEVKGGVMSGSSHELLTSDSLLMSHFPASRYDAVDTRGQLTVCELASVVTCHVQMIH